MNRTVIRVFLLIVYGFLSFIVALLSIRSDGYGSQVPPAITFSWGILPWEYGVVSGSVGLWLFPAFYLLCLFILATICARSVRLTFSLSPIAFHVVGVMVALMNVKPSEPVTQGYLASSVGLAGVYLCSDWWLARRQRRTHSDHETEKRYA